MVFKPWYAFEAKVGIASALSSINVTQTLKTQFDASSDEVYYTGKTKDLSITGVTRDVSKIDVMGNNQLVNEDRPELVQIELTLVYDEGTTNKYIAGPASTSFTVTEGVTRTYYRYTYGEKATSSSDRQKVSLLVVLDDRQGTATAAQKVNILLNNAWCTAQELSLAGDGHVEEKLTFKCMQADYSEEDNFDQTTYSN